MYVEQKGIQLYDKWDFKNRVYRSCSIIMRTISNNNVFRIKNYRSNLKLICE